MKKAAIGALAFLLLTGCWDQLPLRDIRLIDMAVFDKDEKTGDVVMYYAVTTLKQAGQGGGESISESTELKGRTLAEAIGQEDYSAQGPFSGINIRTYVLSETFASDNPIRNLTVLLHAPYTSINTPIVVMDGSVSKFMKENSGKAVPITEKLDDFVSAMELSGMIPNVSMMKFILSSVEEDFALPLIKPTDSSFELSGALLFRQGKSTGVKLGKEQLRMVMLLLGNDNGKQKFTGELERKGVQYAFSIKSGSSKLKVHPVSGGLPKISVEVRLKINVFQLDGKIGSLSADYINRTETLLSDHLEEIASETIEKLQEANCDVLGIALQLKAFHPQVWKSLKWRKDYPELAIEPDFQVQILNADIQ